MSNATAEPHEAYLNPSVLLGEGEKLHARKKRGQMRLIGTNQHKTWMLFRIH